MKCPKCQSDNTDTARFCSNCAAPLTAVEDAHPSFTKTLETPREELTTGSTFAGRYQIIEELGQGGMGRVYKTLDTEINEKIAIKIIKPEIASDEKTIERFRNELKIARRIAHKNVCRMHELNKDQDKYFITMEFVAGGDLKSLIRRTRRLDAGTAISITKQVCGGLAEAHDLGIIHRDLKPSNIMIDDGGSAKIMDFGIARSIKSKGITGSGVMIGTPEYMSPEQVEAGELDQRSDIYSLGIILYEMVTGKLPFDGETAFAIGMKHKNEKPGDPREINPQVPAELSLLILRCLEKDKEKRPQTTREIWEGLTRIEEGIPTVTFSARKILLPVLAVVAVAVLILLFLLLRGPNLDPGRLAVAVFENQTGDQELVYIGRMACDRLTQGIEETGLYEVVPAATVSTILKDVEKGDPIQILAKRTGAGTIVSGTYYLQHNVIHFQSQILDAVEAKVLYALDPVYQMAGSPDPALNLLREKVMGTLACLNDKDLEEPLLLGVKPPTYEAYKEYKVGWDTFMGGEQSRSIAHFIRAMNLDPEFRYAMIPMAAYYMNSSNYVRAKELISQAEEIRDELDPITEMYTIDYAGAWLRGDLEGQYRAQKRAADLYGTTMFNYSIALNANRLNRPREAINRLKALDPDDMFVKDWLGYWNNLSLAYHLLGQHEQELKEARRSRQLFPERMRTIWYEVRAWTASGNIDEIDFAIEKSFSLPPQSMSPGSLMYRAGRMLRAYGFREAAVYLLNRARDWYNNQPPDEKKTRSFRSRMASILYYLESWEESLEVYRELYEERPDSISYLGYLGFLAARLGDRTEAQRISEELKNIDRPYLFGSNTVLRAGIAALLGEKEQAMELIRDSLAQGQDYSILYWSMEFEGLEDYPPFIELKEPKG
jgi:tRNA A-37 threonylcarbamoyl transferase component Bud32/tetratricopeptide (TPR) repeat protein